MDGSEPDLRFERMDKVSVTWKYKGKMVHSYGPCLDANFKIPKKISGTCMET